MNWFYKERLEGIKPQYSVPLRIPEGIKIHGNYKSMAVYSEFQMFKEKFVYV
jgi:hypothetical protein